MKSTCIVYSRKEPITYTNTPTCLTSYNFSMQVGVGKHESIHFATGRLASCYYLVLKKEEWYHEPEQFVLALGVLGFLA